MGQGPQCTRVSGGGGRGPSLCIGPLPAAPGRFWSLGRGEHTTRRKRNYGFRRVTRKDPKDRHIQTPRCAEASPFLHGDLCNPDVPKRPQALGRHEGLLRCNANAHLSLLPTSPCWPPADFPPPCQVWTSPVAIPLLLTSPCVLGHAPLLPHLCGAQLCCWDPCHLQPASVRCGI